MLKRHVSIRTPPLRHTKLANDEALSGFISALSQGIRRGQTECIHRHGFDSQLEGAICPGLGGLEMVPRTTVSRGAREWHDRESDPDQTRLRSPSLTSTLQRLQILNKIVYLRVAQPQIHAPIIMFHDFPKCRKAPIVVETAPRVAEESLEGRSAITAIWCAVGLKIIHAHLRGRMHIPTGLGKKRRHVARGRLRRAIEQFLATRRSLSVKASYRWLWRRDAELIEMQQPQFCRD